MTIKSMVKHAGIKINGDNPWDIQVHNPRFYRRVLMEGSLGLGESYMDGDWDSEKIEETLARIITAQLDQKVKKTLALAAFVLKNKVMNVTTKKGAKKVAKIHYDLGNELYERMLDKDLNYTCAYWKNASTLHAAQNAKNELICKKLYLKKGMRVLDIGAGYGNFLRYAARNYGVTGVGISLSKEQNALARKMSKGLPLTYKLMDYRDLKGEKFDRIISIGMFEHVNYRNHEAFMKVAADALKDDGLFMLHTIGSRESYKANDAWTDKYIFPNSLIPSLAQISKAVEYKFTLEDIHNFGPYYHLTLMEWFKNFDKNWLDLKKNYPEKYDDRFYRMWKYYLLSCAGAFKARSIQLYQIVLSKGYNGKIYQSVR